MSNYDIIIEVQSRLEKYNVDKINKKSTSKKVALFYNPVAGGGTFARRLDDVARVVQAAGMQLMLWRISSNEQLLADMQKLKIKKCHTIIAAGGDGTVHGVVNAMMKIGLRVPLAIFPVGTANDTARNLGIKEEFEQYCELALTGVLQAVDVGKTVAGAKKDTSYFINVASAGFMTDVAHQVSSRSKNILGKGAYYLKGMQKLSELKTFPLEVMVDDIDYSGEAFMFLLLNGQGAGSIKEIVPGASMSDGLFDLVIVKDGSPVEIIDTLRKTMTRQHLEDSLLTYVRGKEFQIKLPKDIETDLDGEAGPTSPWQISVLPGAVMMRVPSREEL